jgi:flagellar hook-associated protein 1
MFTTLHTAIKGMNAQQLSLHTTGHNISNAGTEGYTRQRVELKAERSFTLSGVGQLGTGVRVDSVIRTVNDFLTKQIREETSSLSNFNTRSGILAEVEAVLNEPTDFGLGFSLSEVFGSWQELSKNPESLLAKTIVVQTSTAMAENLNGLIDRLERIEEKTGTLIDTDLRQINTLVGSIESINRQIARITVTGNAPNDLLDQRDQLLKQLSEVTDFQSTADKFGRANVVIGGVEVLTSQGEITVIDEDMDAEDYNQIMEGVKGGSLKANLEGKAYLQQQLDLLTGFAEGIAGRFNEVHSDAEGGRNFYMIENGRLHVNPDLVENPNLVLPGEAYTSPSGDGSRATDIANLRFEKFLEGKTPQEKYNAIVTGVGLEKQLADKRASNQTALLDQMNLRREAGSGISLDEEVANLVKFQKSYEANARVMAIMIEMLDVLINRTGV